MKFYFTIYLFAKIFNFNIDNAGRKDRKKIHQFFDIIPEDYPILTNTIKGKNKEIRSPGRGYFASRVIVNKDNPELKWIDESLLRYVYEVIIGSDCDNKDSADMLSELLIKSLEPKPEQQLQMYNSYNRNEEAFKAVTQLKERCFNESSLSPEKQHLIPHEYGKKERDIFFDKFGSNISGIDSVQLAFHGGHTWRLHGDYTKLLRGILSHKIPVRVLINEVSVAEEISPYMRDQIAYQLDEYPGFPKNRDAWIKLATIFDSLELRECPTPLMRSYYCFTMKNQTESESRISFYTYGNGDVSKNYKLYLTPESKYFELYRNEFEYLWKLSSIIPIPRKNEQME